MRPRFLIALLVLGAVAAAGWYFFARSPAGNADDASATDGPMRGSAGAHGGQPSLPGGSGSGATGRGLDCARPAGNAAMVDDQPITLERLCSSLSRIGAVKPTGVDLRQAKLVLDRMIDGVIVHRALEQANLKVTDAEVDASLKELGVATASDAGAKPDPGVDIPLLQEQMRERLELQKLAASQAKLDVSEQEVDAELAAGAPGIDRGQGIRVEGWLYRIPPNADAAAQAKAEQAVQAFSKAIPAVKPEAAAKQHGLTPVPPFLVSDQGLEPDLEAAAQALSKGQLSRPIKTKVGSMVIRMIERVEGTKLDDKFLRARVRKALETRKAAGAGKDVMTKLRNAARIEILVDL